MKPLVSISCITYNHEKYIADAIEGFLMQKTSFPIEIIIHDDASTDGTAEIIKSYERKYPGLIKPIYQKENQWSKGIKPSPTYVWPKARGKYIALCEGDDYWTDPLKLQKQVNVLEANPKYSGSFHETQLIFEDGTYGRIFGQSSSEDFYAIDSFAVLSPFHTNSFVFRKESMNSIPKWFNKVVSGDMALFSIVASRGPLRKVPEVMSVYRKHDAGFSSNKHVVETFHQKRIELMRFLNEFHEFKYNDKALEIINHHKKQLPKPVYLVFLNKIKYKMKCYAQKFFL